MNLRVIFGLFFCLQFINLSAWVADYNADRPHQAIWPLIAPRRGPK